MTTSCVLSSVATAGGRGESELIVRSERVEDGSDISWSEGEYRVLVFRLAKSALCSACHSLSDSAASKGGY